MILMSSGMFGAELITAQREREGGIIGSQRGRKELTLFHLSLSLAACPLGAKPLGLIGFAAAFSFSALFVSMFFVLLGMHSLSLRRRCSSARLIHHREI